MGRSSKSKTAKTPQPNVNSKRKSGKLLHSEPPPKRKKLAQELDEEISDNEFDAELSKMSAQEKLNIASKLEKLKASIVSDNSSSDLNDSEDEDDREDSKNKHSYEDSEDGSSEVEDDDDDDDDDDEEEESEDEIDSDEDNDMELFVGNDSCSDDDDIKEESEGETSGSGKKKLTKKTKLASKKIVLEEKAEERAPIEAAEMAQDLVAKELRDNRTLFLKDLQKSITVDQVRALSSDILEVRIKPANGRGRKDLRCVYIEFKDEETAIKNKTNLQDKEIDKQKITVDFVGEKSIFRPRKAQFTSSVDPKKLFISGFGKETTTDDLKKLLPSSSAVDFPRYKTDNSPKGFAFIHFLDETACKTAHAALQDTLLNGRVLTVMYAKKSNPLNLSSKLQNSKKQKKSQKKQTRS